MRHLLLIFSLCLCGDLLTSLFLNQRVMTDEAYLAMLSLEPGTPQSQDILNTVRGWRWVGHAATPVVLFARVAVGALVVQLLLMALRARHALRPILTASIWAQMPLVVGRAAKAVSLSVLPTEGRTPLVVARPAVSLGDLLGLPSGSIPAASLLDQVSVFTAAWCIVFVGVLRDGRRLRSGTVVLAVVGAALILGGARWAGWLYLTRFEALSAGP